jgi:5-dehydro-2-deoxygluconokinase
MNSNAALMTCWASKSDPLMTRPYDLICLGRSTLDLFGSEIGATFADQNGFRAYVGGCPTNICVAAQRLGLSTALVTGVGADYVRDFLLKFLRAEGVDTRWVVEKPGRHTNTVMVALQPPEEMQFVPFYANNADLELTFDDMQAAPLADCRALLFSGMGLLQDPSRSATQYAAEYARAHGAKVVMDLDYRAPMWSDARLYGIVARRTLGLVDIALGTEVEVQAAAGIEETQSAVQKLLQIAHEAVIVKKGAQGSTVYTPDGAAHEIAPFKVEVVNFLGAGDAYAAGLVYGYLQGWELPRAARLGSACGALIVAEAGTANAMPTLETALSFMNAGMNAGGDG